METISSPLVQVNLPAATGIRPGISRQFLGRRFVYCVISQRARGLSIGINMNPDGRCNFDCIYCEVDRRRMKPRRLPVRAMVKELKEVLALAQNDLRCLECFANVPGELLKLKEVALSGDGEPTLCPNFAEIVRSVIHLRSRRLFPLFKIVLITNGSGLNPPEVREGIDLLTNSDEVWAKLDAGTQTFMDAINRPGRRLPGVGDREHSHPGPTKAGHHSKPLCARRWKRTSR